MEHSKAFLVLLLLAPQLALGANILFFYAFATHSHRTAIEPLAHALADRGHNVTFVCPVKPVKPNPKITEWVPQSMAEHYKQSLTGLVDNGFPDRLKDKYANWLTDMRTLLDGFVEEGCKQLVRSPELKDWVENSRFDVVIIGHPPNKCAYAFAHYWNASVILSSASTFVLSEEDVWGLPLESSWLPRYQLSNVFTPALGFCDRVYNALNPLLYHWYRHWVNIPRMNKMIREFMGDPNLPSLDELESLYTSLVFINQHFSEEYARSLPPFVVPVGGMHCRREHKSLPEDLEEFIQGAGDEGFIVVSFGSMVKMSLVPEYLVNIFFDAIRDLKVRFLWRWDTDPPANLPPNVLTRKWLPQQDLLAHPKIKGLITHGGLMSTQQAICHAVPVIAIPIQYDQPFNARKVSHHGIGIHLELSEITTENFREAVLRLAHDKSLKAKMVQVSERNWDRPMSAVDTAVYWTEYILRHKDCSHLKPLGVYQPWWKRRLLDVWFLVYMVCLGAIVAIVKVFKFALRCLLASKGKVKTS